MVASTSVTSLVKIGAHLDVRSVSGVRTALNAVLESAADDGGDIVIDMADLDVIDATGLGMLTAAHLRAERAGHHLVLRNCSKEIRRVLALTRLNRILHLDRRHYQLSA
jgi:anti-sigma B factor antagonist